MKFVAVALCLIAIAAVMAVSVNATPTCVYRSCACTSKDCNAFGPCLTYSQESGTCGQLDRICDCVSGHIYKYSGAGCTGSITATYINGHCYDKSQCFFIDSCLEPSPSATPSNTPSNSPSPSRGPVGGYVGLKWPITGKYLVAGSNYTVNATGTTKQTWHVLRWPAGKYSIKSYLGYYLTALPDGTFIANSTVLGDTQLFNTTLTAGPKWIFRSYFGGYLASSLDGVVSASTDPNVFWN